MILMPKNRARIVRRNKIFWGLLGPIEIVIAASLQGLVRPKLPANKRPRGEGFVGHCFSFVVLIQIFIEIEFFQGFLVFSLHVFCGICQLMIKIFKSPAGCFFLPHSCRMVCVVIWVVNVYIFSPGDMMHPSLAQRALRSCLASSGGILPPHKICNVPFSSFRTQVLETHF